MKHILSLLVVLAAGNIYGQEPLSTKIKAGECIILKANASAATEARGGFIWFKDGVITGTPLTDEDSLVVKEPGSYTMVYINADGYGSPVSQPVLIAADTGYKTGTYTPGMIPKRKVIEIGSPSFIQVYPNPATSTVYINTGAAIQKRVQILDMKGVLLQDIEPSSSTMELDISKYPSGNYLIYVISSPYHSLSYRISKM